MILLSDDVNWTVTFKWCQRNGLMSPLKKVHCVQIYLTVSSNSVLRASLDSTQSAWQLKSYTQTFPDFWMFEIPPIPDGHNCFRVQNKRVRYSRCMGDVTSKSIYSQLTLRCTGFKTYVLQDICDIAGDRHNLHENVMCLERKSSRTHWRGAYAAKVLWALCQTVCEYEHTFVHKNGYSQPDN